MSNHYYYHIIFNILHESREIDTIDAIKHHIHIKLDDDPAYYRKLSEKLEDMPGVNKIVRLNKFELKNIRIDE